MVNQEEPGSSCHVTATSILTKNTNSKNHPHLGSSPFLLFINQSKTKKKTARHVHRRHFGAKTASTMLKTQSPIPRWRCSKRSLVEPYNLYQGVPYPALRQRNKPRRVDHYFSSWVIRPVQSRKGDGLLSSCEVILLHSEDMGIPRDVAKLGVRHGMWGTVKKLHGGFRAYQTVRKQDATPSRCALMATIATPYDGGVESVPEDQKSDDINTGGGKEGGGVDWRWLAVGGVVAVVCGLRTGAIGKVLVIGAGQRFGRRR